jgi:hypothetical protein
LLQPYFSDSSHVRWRALVGNPILTQPGRPLTFDYPGNVQSLLISGDGSNLVTTQYEKGSGSNAATVWAYATDPTLTGVGWPLLEGVGNSHNDSVNQAALSSWASADLSLYGRPVETWSATVRADLVPLIGTYTAGIYVSYNVQGHFWQPDGVYTQRLIGLANGLNPGELVHVTQAVQGLV